MPRKRHDPPGTVPSSSSSGEAPRVVAPLRYFHEPVENPRYKLFLHTTYSSTYNSTFFLVHGYNSVCHWGLNDTTHQYLIRQPMILIPNKAIYKTWCNICFLRKYLHRSLISPLTIIYITLHSFGTCREMFSISYESFDYIMYNTIYTLKSE